MKDTTTLIVIDEADWLKMGGLEQVRDIFDHGDIGVILIDMPGIEKRLARYLPPQRLHPAMEALLKNRIGAHVGYQLKEADALWGQQGCAFLDEFLKLTKDNYAAGFHTVDFRGQAKGHGRPSINGSSSRPRAGSKT